MMTADSNIFLYAWDSRDATKAGTCQLVVEGLRKAGSSIGLQVVGEVQNVLRRKFKQPAQLAVSHARFLLDTFDTFTPSRANAKEALDLMSLERHSYWDALLLTAARDAGCTAFFTEDLADRTWFGPLEIVNPFSASGPSDRARKLLNI